MIYEKFLILFFAYYLPYNFIRRCYMYFCISYLFSKYVISTIYENIIKMRESNIIDEENEDLLYESYLKLEELLRDDYI